MSNEFDQKKFFWNTDVEDNNSQILSYMFDNNQKVFFKIETGNFDNGVIGLHCLQKDPMQMAEDEKNNLWPDHIFDDFNDAKDSFTFDLSPLKKFVENIVEHFTEQTDKNFTFDDIKKYLDLEIFHLPNQLDWISFDDIPNSQPQDDYYKGKFLNTSFGIYEYKYNPAYFYLEHIPETDKINICLYEDNINVFNNAPTFFLDFKGTIETAKKLV
jgi:hypothetical protein